MSQNGQWVVGQTAWDPDANTAWGFIYNVQDEVLNILESDLYEFGAAYGVNDNGYAVGWVDDLDVGTLRMPAVFAPDGEIILVGEDVGAMSGMNSMGIAVEIGRASCRERWGRGRRKRKDEGKGGETREE